MHNYSEQNSAPGPAGPFSSVRPGVSHDITLPDCSSLSKMFLSGHALSQAQVVCCRFGSARFQMIQQHKKQQLLHCAAAAAWVCVSPGAPGQGLPVVNNWKVAPNPIKGS